MKGRRAAILRKILRRVIIKDTGHTTACWLWDGPTSGSGRGGHYGRMCLDGATVAVHLVMFTLFFGYIPPKKQVDHKCNVRKCCNPDHLELVTHRENQKRRAARQKELTYEE